jgi:radical SAM protein (TIGR01212 family)
MFRTYKDYLSERFPTYRQVRKVTLDAGFTCPNMDGSKGRGGCSYCDNRSFSPAVANRGATIRQQLDNQIPKVRQKYPAAGILAYFQPYTNTYAPVDQLHQAFEPALLHPEVLGLSIGTRPDCLGDDIVEYLCHISTIKPLIVEIGLQTANDQTLASIGRGHTRADFEDCMDRCATTIRRERALGRPGFDLASHLILGLPGETMADFEATAKCVATYPFQSVKIHPLHLVRGTRMAKEWEANPFRMLSFDEYCEAAAKVIQILPATIAIERFTGDAPGDSLIAPEWCGDRNRIVARVEEILRQKA